MTQQFVRLTVCRVNFSKKKRAFRYGLWNACTEFHVCIVSRLVCRMRDKLTDEQTGRQIKYMIKREFYNVNFKFNEADALLMMN